MNRYNRYNPQDNKAKLGKSGEEIVRKWLQEQGYLLLPTSLIQDGGAPMLTGTKLKVILPNNLTWKIGEPGWVEVKTKSNATLHLKTQRWEHGLPLRHWNAYLEVQKVTHIPVALAVLELSTQLVLLATLDELATNKRISPMKGELHIFINRATFIQYPININLPEPIQPLATRTLSQHKPPINKQPTNSILKRQ